MAKFLDIDGNLTMIEPQDPNKGFQLKELYELIGCDLVEIVDLPDGMILIVDEEGACKENACLNPNASLLANTYIFGNAVYCKSEEFK